MLEKGRDEKSRIGQDDARHAIAVQVAEGPIPVWSSSLWRLQSAGHA